MRHPLHRFLLIGRLDPRSPHPDDERRANIAHDFVRTLAERRSDWWDRRPRLIDQRQVFAGWMVRPEHAFDVVARMHRITWPWRFRFRLNGAVELPSGTAARQRLLDDIDADELIEWIDERRPWCPPVELPLELALVGRHRKPEEHAVELLGRAHVEAMARWTPKQRGVCHAAMEGRRASEIAREQSTSRQAVAAVLRRGGVADLLRIENAVREWISLRVHDRRVHRSRTRPLIRL
jgi:hypothetical protein